MLNNTNIVSKNRWSVLFWNTIAYLYDSLALITLSICIPFIIKEMNISLSQSGLLSSATMIGGAFGAIIFGKMANRLGNKKAIVWALIVCGVFTVFVYFANTFESLLLLRFFTGIGIGGVWGPCVAMVSESWDAKNRSWAISFVLSSFAMGSILASFLGAHLLSQLNWRVFFMISGTSVIAGLLFYYFGPEDNTETKRGETKKTAIKLNDLFLNNVFKITIPATMIAFFYMGGFWGLNSWVPTFLVQERGFNINEMGIWNMMIYIGMLAGYPLCGLLSNYLGRKGTLLLCFFVSALSIPFYILCNNSDILFWLSPLMGFWFGGLAGLQGVYYSELFPQEIRALGGGFCFNMGRAGAVIAPYVVGYLADIKGLTIGMGTVSLFFLLGCFMLLLLPETYKRH